MPFIAKYKSMIAYLLFIAVFSLAAFEVVLRVEKRNITWSEGVGHGYVSYYNEVKPTWFHTWTPNDSVMLDHGDFKYPVKTNSLGLRDREFKYNDPAAKHILCIGDSYTEGVGAPYDSSWPRLMQNYLNTAGPAAEVIDAGVSGSDPFYEYMLYKYKLLPCQARYVMLCINSSDCTDYIFRGGMERFKPNGTTEFNKGPWFEPLYHYSYVMRFLINDIKHYPNANLFVRDTTAKSALVQKGMLEIVQVIDSMNRLAAQQQARLLVVIHPCIGELLYNSSDNRNYKMRFEEMQAILESKSICVINLWQPLGAHFNRQNYLQYSYVHDSHYNGRGYNIMAREILNEINRKYPQYWNDTIAVQ